MAITWSDKNSDLQIKERETAAYQAGKEAGVMNALMMISAQKPGQSPGDDKTGDNRHDKDWPPPEPLKPKLAHGEGRGPQPKYHDEYNRPIKGRKPWEQMFPDGTLREIPWQKEDYLKEHPDLQISGLSEFDTLMDRFRKGSQNPKSGSIKHHPDDIRKLILSIGGRVRA